MTLRIDVVEMMLMGEGGDVEENKLVCSKNTTQQMRDLKFMFISVVFLNKMFFRVECARKGM